MNKKSVIYIGSILISIFLMLLLGASVNFGNMPPMSHSKPGNTAFLWDEDTIARIEINCTLPIIPSTLPIMQVKEDPITKGDATLIASRLIGGMDNFQDEIYGWKGVDESREIVVFKYGGFIGYDHEQFMKKGVSSEEYPSLSECKRISDNFLKTMMEDDTVPKNIVVEYKNRRSDIRKVIHRNGTIMNTTWTNTHINYVQKIQGYELYGPGAKIRVYMNENGTVTGFMGRFWNLEPIRKVELLSPKEAIEKLDVSGEVAYITSVKLVYYIDYSGRQVIHPYYYINGVIETRNHGTTDFMKTIHAIQ